MRVCVSTTNLLGSTTANPNKGSRYNMVMVRSDVYILVTTLFNRYMVIIKLTARHAKKQNNAKKNKRRKKKNNQYQYHIQVSNHYTGQSEAETLVRKATTTLLLLITELKSV